MVADEENLSKLESKVCCWLKIRKRMLQKCNTRLWSIYWIRNFSIRNCATNRRFNTGWGFQRCQGCFSFKRNCLVPTTQELTKLLELTKLTGVSLVLEDKMEWGTEADWSLVLCDETESFVTNGELTFSWPDE